MWKIRFSLDSIVLSWLIRSLWPYKVSCKILCLFTLAWCLLGYWRFHRKPGKVISPSMFIWSSVSLFRNLHVTDFLVLITINYSYFFQFFFILFLSINAKIFIKFLFLNNYLWIFLEWIGNYVTKFDNIWFLLQILQSYIQIELFGIISWINFTCTIL